MRNSKFDETLNDSTVARALQLLQAALPAGWTVTVGVPAAIDGRRTDGTIVVSARDGTTASLVLEVKATANVGAMAVVAQALRLRAISGATPLLVTEYATPALRAECERNDVNYIDTTGWISLRLDRPAVFIRTDGAKRDPRPPRDGAIARLDGRGAGRTIRGLVDGPTPVGVRELAARSGVSPGSVSKVLTTLERHDVIERVNGRVTLVRRRALLERWTTDYSFLKSNRSLGRYLAPRGLDALRDALAYVTGVVATGSLAARVGLSQGVAAVTPLSQIALFALDPKSTAKQLGLVPTAASSTTVFIAAPYDTSLLSSVVVDIGDIPVAPLSQALADLLTLPGRAPDEALQVMDLLGTSDGSWQ